MPKGDREILKADTEDGYTKIANLLLEATASAKFSGVESAVIMTLWRYTYGWTNGNKGQRTEVEISLEGLARSVGINPVYAGRVLAGLVDNKVVSRKDLGQGKGYTYSMNTRVNLWCEGKLNSIGLTEKYGVPLTKKYRVPPTKKYIPLATNLATPKERERKLNKEDSINKDTEGFSKKYGDESLNNENLIAGQSIEKAISIANGNTPALPRAAKYFQKELTRRGIKWRPAKKKKVKTNA